MRDSRPIRFATLALIALLVFAATAGVVWHHHSHSTETSCPICHLNHQPIGSPLAAHRAPALASAGIQLQVPKPAFVPAPAAPRLPARAPPIA